MYGLIFFLFVWHICLYTPVAHITWNTRGFFKTNEIEDFSGGLVVHMTAGITAAAGHLSLIGLKRQRLSLADLLIQKTLYLVLSSFGFYGLVSMLVNPMMLAKLLLSLS